MTEDRNRSARGDGQGVPLSGREREILGLIAGGDSGAQIAEALVLSPETVRTHIRNAMSKLGASSRAQAVALAFQRNEIGDQADVAGDAGGAPAERESGSTSAPRGGRARAAADLAAGKSDATLTALLAAATASAATTVGSTLPAWTGETLECVDAGGCTFVPRTISGRSIAVPFDG